MTEFSHKDELKQTQNEDSRRYLVMMVFYPVIVKTVHSRDILMYLGDMLKDNLSELRRLDKDGKHEESMKKLLNYLDDCQCPGKWRSFVDALKEADYESLYNCLEHLEDLPTNSDDEDYQLILIFLSTIINQVRLENSGILPLLLQHKIISENQLQSIRACIQNHSNQDATLELFTHLHRKTRKWYTVFLEALIKDGQMELVTDIDPKFISKREQKIFNFDSMDYEINVLSGEGDASDEGVCSGNISDQSTDWNDLEDDNNINTKSFHKPVDMKELNIPLDKSEMSLSNQTVDSEHIESRESRPYSMTFQKTERQGSEIQIESRVMKQIDPSLTQFPEYKPCPKTSLKSLIPESGFFNKLLFVLSATDPWTKSIGYIFSWNGQMSYWRTGTFKLWCDDMEQWFHVKRSNFKSRDDVKQVVKAWINHMKNHMNDAWGTVDWLGSQLDIYIQLLDVVQQDDMINSLTQSPVIHMIDDDSFQPTISSPNQIENILQPCKDKHELQERIEETKTKIQQVKTNDKQIMDKMCSYLNQIINNKTYNKQEIIGRIGSFNTYGINCDVVIDEVRDIWYSLM